MKLKEKVKTYNFWVSISSAIFLIINLIGKKYNFVVDESWFHDVITSICSLLVLLGIIAPPITLTNKNNQIDFECREDDDIDEVDKCIDESIQDNFKNIDKKIENAEKSLNNETIFENNQELEDTESDIEEFQNQK